MMYNICSDTIQWQIPDFLSDGNSNGRKELIETFEKIRGYYYYLLLLLGNLDSTIVIIETSRVLYSIMIEKTH